MQFQLPQGQDKDCRVPGQQGLLRSPRPGARSPMPSLPCGHSRWAGAQPAQDAGALGHLCPLGRDCLLCPCCPSGLEPARAGGSCPGGLNVAQAHRQPQKVR